MREERRSFSNNFKKQIVEFIVSGSAITKKVLKRKPDTRFLNKK